jgi:hypothetical protein
VNTSVVAAVPQHCWNILVGWEEVELARGARTSGVVEEVDVVFEDTTQARPLLVQRKGGRVRVKDVRFEQTGVEEPGFPISSNEVVY